MTDTEVRPSRLGWHSSVPPNGFANRPAAPTGSNSNPLGLDTPDTEIETTPEHRNLVAGDPTCADWTRSYDDPNVVAFRERLNKHNGIKGLEILDQPRSTEPPSCSTATDSWSWATCSTGDNSNGCGRRPIGRSTRCWRSTRHARQAGEPVAFHTATRSAAARRRAT